MINYVIPYILLPVLITCDALMLGLDALGVAEHLSSSEIIDRKSFVDEA